MLLGVMVLLWPFAVICVFVCRTVVFFFLTLGTWAIQSLHFGHPSNAKDRSHLVEQSLSQIRHKLVTHTSLMPPADLVGKTLLQMKGLVADLVFMFLFWYQPKHPSVPKKGMKALCRHQLKFSTFNRWCRCVLQQQCLTFLLCTLTYRLGKKKQGFSGIPEGPFWATPLDGTQTQQRQLYLVTRKSHCLWFHLPFFNVCG